MGSAVTQRRPAAPRAIEKTFPAPVGGWNARDSVAAMAPTDAIALENWFPRPSYVEMRGGSYLHMNQLPGTCKTLAVHHGLDGGDDLFVFTDQGVYIATFGGSSGGSNLGTRTNGKHQTVMFGDGTNQWLIAVNGADKPWYWNGTTYVEVDAASSPALTGITSTHIVSVAVFKNRLLFIRNDKMAFDYLAAGAAGGAVSTFDLSSIASLGGYLMAIAVWSRDAGDGPDDYAVFITSEGQAIVYQGTDPSSASTWSLVGTFHIGKPLGRRCVLKYGADPIILTEGGAFPLSSLLASGDERNKFALSFKIQGAFTEAARTNFSTFGWCVVSFPEQDAIVINRPRAEDGAHEQYVMNTISKAWCKFTGWDAEHFVVFNRELYFCQGGSVYKAWTHVGDNTGFYLIEGFIKPITYYAKQAYQDFGSPALKRPNLFMPVLTANRLLNYAAGIDVDFIDRQDMPTTSVATSNRGRWGAGTWGASRWGTGSSVTRQWGATASWPGRWLSGKLKIVSDEVSGQWVGSVMRFEVGEGL